MRLKNSMMLDMYMSDLGRMRNFLGVEVIQVQIEILFTEGDMLKKF